MDDQRGLRRLADCGKDEAAQSALLRHRVADVCANIEFLSVYPTEREALYPPLTYLRAISAQNEVFGDTSVLVATVEPNFM